MANQCGKSEISAFTYNKLTKGNAWCN